jgi:hypothetical protein
VIEDDEDDFKPKTSNEENQLKEEKDEESDD